MKRDFYLVSIIGFLVGWLIFLPLKNIGYEINPTLIMISVIGFTLFAPLALFVLKLLSGKWLVFVQFGNFAAVGTLNTLLDLGILNLLIFLTDIASGPYFTAFKAVSFLVGTTNSYFWNKLWTFQNRLPVTFHEYLRFALFTFVGALINVGVATFIVNVIGPPEGVSLKLWANTGAIIAVFAALFWNFLSYKKIVFKKLVTTA